MKLYLAPMDGIFENIQRALLTEMGGIDLCMTEFLRVCNRLLPNSCFYKICPELEVQGSAKGKTPSGVPVHLQILGSDPDAMAENAQKGIELGAPGININFGCPAKTVNRHDGGASG